MRLYEKLQAGSYPNCQKLADELEVSSKTIQRDFDYMRDQLELPIEYNESQFGYYFTKPVGSFPGLQVTEGEVLALFVAQKALQQYRGTSFERPLRAAFERVCERLGDQIDFQWNDVNSAISFRGIGATVADLDLFEKVSRAVFNSHEIEFDYKKVPASRYEMRRVQPYHLGCIENQWYVFGQDLVRRQLRTFALPRMRKLRDTGVAFHRPADFSIAKLLGGSFGVMSGNGRHRVRVRFDAFAARLVSEREWHASQKIRRLPEDEIELTMTLSGLKEVERWILSWGLHARVLEPPELVRCIREVSETLAGRYGEG